MPRPIPDRIAALKAQKEKLANQLSALEAKAKQADRKRDTRRKIVVGGTVLLQMEKDPAFALLISGLLNQSVGRPIDREAIADLLQPVGKPPVASNGNAAALPSQEADDVSSAYLEAVEHALGRAL